MYARHATEMRERFGVGIELPVVIRAVALVRAHEGTKRRQFRPAHEELLRSVHAIERGVAADVAMVQAVSAHREPKSSAERARQPVIVRPVDILIACPHHGAPALAPREARAHEEKRLLLRTGLLDRLRIAARPEHGPEVVSEEGRCAVVEHRVGRQIFAEVRHPTARAEFEDIFR